MVKVRRNFNEMHAYNYNDAHCMGEKVSVHEYIATAVLYIARM